MGTAFFDQFSRVAIVNLARRADRREEMLAELGRYGVDVDGNRIGFFEAIEPEDRGDFPNIGIRGCFLSHLEVLKAARADAVETLLLLEDDAHFGKAFSKHHHQLVSGLHGVDWDFFYAGHRAEFDVSPEGPVTAVSAADTLMLAHAVAFSKAAISAAVPYLEAILKRPLGSPEGGPMHVDGAYNWVRKAHPELRTCIATPQIVTQRSSTSDITPATGLRQKVSTSMGLRRFKNWWT